MIGPYRLERRPMNLRPLFVFMLLIGALPSPASAFPDSPLGNSDEGHVRGVYFFVPPSAGFTTPLRSATRTKSAR